jgi:hypothetical protein
MVNYINVICTDESGSVCENKLFIGNKKAITKAELCFTKKIKELNDKVDKDTIEVALDEGYYTYNICAVFLSHPEVKK